MIKCKAKIDITTGIIYILGRDNEKKLIQIVGEKDIINGSTVCGTYDYRSEAKSQCASVLTNTTKCAT